MSVFTYKKQSDSSSSSGVLTKVEHWPDQMGLSSLFEFVFVCVQGHDFLLFWVTLGLCSPHICWYIKVAKIVMLTVTRRIEKKLPVAA